MATSSVEICNSALLKLGCSMITSLSDTTKQGLACNAQYDRLRKEILRAHPWNFAITHADLAATANTPVWDKWTVEFAIPTDVLRILDTNLGDEAWEIGYNADGLKVLFCNSDDCQIKYIKDITNTTRFDPTFEEALAFRLAADLAYHMVQSQTVQQQMFTYYRQAMATAMSYDGQESSPQQVEATAWTTDVRG